MGQASDARHARQGARAEWQNEALEAARSSHSHSSSAVAAAGRARECNRPRTQVRWLRRGLIGVEGRHHTGHRVRVCSRPAFGLQLQHRVGHRRESSEAVLQPAGSICSDAGSARLSETRALGLASTQRSPFNENARVACWDFLLGECHAVTVTAPRRRRRRALRRAGTRLANGRATRAAAPPLLDDRRQAVPAAR